MPRRKRSAIGCPSSRPSLQDRVEESKRKQAFLEQDLDARLRAEGRLEEDEKAFGVPSLQELQQFAARLPGGSAKPGGPVLPLVDSQQTTCLSSTQSSTTESNWAATSASGSSEWHASSRQLLQSAEGLTNTVSLQQCSANGRLAEH